MLGKTSGASPPHTHTYTHTHTPKQGNWFTSANSCRSTAKKCVDLDPADVLCVSTLKRQLKIMRQLTDAIFIPVKPFATAPGPLRECDSP